jgi:hypothetical protein
MGSGVAKLAAGGKAFPPEPKRGRETPNHRSTKRPANPTDEGDSENGTRDLSLAISGKNRDAQKTSDYFLTSQPSA